MMVVEGNANVFGVSRDSDDFAAFFQNFFWQEGKLEMSEDEAGRMIRRKFVRIVKFQKYIAFRT